MVRLLSIGFPLHAELDVPVVDQGAQASLDDADVILFRLPSHRWTARWYQGKHWLDEGDSARHLEMLHHWESELLNALKDGKTVFVEASAPDEVFVETGQKTFSGTGRNRHTTVHLEHTSSYKALPFRLPKMIVSNGDVMKLGGGADVIRSFWNVFGRSLRYEVKFYEDEEWNPLITTPTGSRSVALQAKVGSGAVFLLPRIGIFSDYDWSGWDAADNDEDETDEGDDNEDAEEGLTDQDYLSASASPTDQDYLSASASLVEQLIAIDAIVRDPGQSPPPDWASGAEFTTGKMLATKEEILRLQKEREILDARLLEVRGEYGEASTIQELLYEKGRRLESAVIRGLRAFGYSAEHYEDNLSEFDAVFSDGENRFLGEVEGKDTAAVNIDKISQLERNVAEDFQRDEVDEHAKGVLFGNPQRLTAPDERTLTFTDKCVLSGERNKFALVLTPTMFGPVRYLEETDDPEYAATCRRAILDAEGRVVVFPNVPNAKKKRPRVAAGKRE